MLPLLLCDSLLGSCLERRKSVLFEIDVRDGILFERILFTVGVTVNNAMNDIYVMIRLI